MTTQNTPTEAPARPTRRGKTAVKTATPAIETKDAQTAADASVLDGLVRTDDSANGSKAAPARRRNAVTTTHKAGTPAPAADKPARSMRSTAPAARKNTAKATPAPAPAEPAATVEPGKLDHKRALARQMAMALDAFAREHNLNAEDCAQVAYWMRMPTHWDEDNTAADGTQHIWWGPTYLPAPRTSYYTQTRKVTK